MASKAVGLLTFTFGANMKGFNKAMTKSQKKLKKFGKSLQRTGKSLTMGLTVPIVALGVAAFKTFADFEQSMLKVKAISGATQVEFMALTESAQLLGSTTMFTATQVAQLQLNLSKLGLTPTEINKSTESILNLAQATDSDLGEAATVAASIMNAFGLEAEDMTMISDVMADAFSSTALDLNKFQTAMASVAPVAKQAGQDIQGTSAILGVLVNNGIEASSAGTALRNVFLELANKGLTWDQAMEKIQNSINPLKTAMDLFGKRGAAVATIIANNGAEIQDLTADFNDSAGEAQAMADIMDSGVGGAMRRMKSQLEGVAIELGQHLVPVFEKFVKWVEKGVEWFKTLDDSQKKNVVKWGLILAAIGPVLIIIGKLSLGIGALIPAFTKLGALIMAQPWIALAAALLLVGTAAYSVVKSLTAQFDAQQALNDVTKEAGSRMAEEVASIETLVYAINTETTSLEEKTTALNTLKKLYPGYYDEVDEATFSQDAMALSTANLKAALLEMAMLDVYADKLKKVTAEIIELEQSITAGDINTSTRILTGSTVGVLTLGSGFGAVAVAAADYFNVFNQPIQDISNVTQLEKLKKTQAFYLEGQLELEKKTKDYKLLVPKVTHGVSNLGKETDKVTDSTKEYSNAIGTNSIELGDQFQQYSLATDQFKGMYEWTLRLTDAQKLGAAGFQMFGDILTSSLDGALDNQENFFKSFLKNIKRAIRSLLVQLAVMTLIQAVMPFGMGGMGKGAFKLSNIKSNLMGLMNIPMQEGALVTGPTTALIGEGIGTTSANPEVVAPLDKLKSMMGGGEQHITVTGKLVGNDIFLSNAKTGVNRLRTV